MARCFILTLRHVARCFFGYSYSWLTIEGFSAPGAVFYSVLRNGAVFYSVLRESCAVFYSVLMKNARCFILC